MRRNLKEDDGGRMEYLKALEDALKAENYLCTWGDEPLGKLIVDTDLGMFDIDYVPGEWVYVIHFSGPNKEFTTYRKYTDDVVELIVNVVEDQLDDWSTEHYIESKKSNKKQVKESTLDLFGQNAKVHKDKNWKPGLTKKQIKERRMPYSEIPQVEDYIGTARAKGFECIEGSLVSRTKEVFTPVIMKINGNVEARLRIFSQGNYTIFTDKGGWEGLDLEEFEKDLDDLRSLYESVSKKSNRIKESKVILHFDLEDGTHKALPFDSEETALEYLDSEDFPIGEWVGDYRIETVKETKPANGDDYDYQVLQPEDVEKLNGLVKEIKDHNEDSWGDWIDLAIDIGRKYLGKSLSRYGEGEYTPFEDLINECEPFVYYRTTVIDKLLNKRLAFQKELEQMKESTNLKERRIESGELNGVEDYLYVIRSAGLQYIEGEKTKKGATPVVIKLTNGEARLRIFEPGNYTLFTDFMGWEGLTAEEFADDLKDLLSFRG